MKKMISVASSVALIVLAAVGIETVRNNYMVIQKQKNQKKEFNG